MTKQNLYDKLDDTLMNVSNKAVKAWNWTTGGTKADLANTLLSTGLAVSATLSPYYLAGAPLYFMAMKEYNKSEKNEAEALEDGKKDLEVELFKENCLRPLASTLSALSAAIIPLSLSRGEGFEDMKGAIGSGVYLNSLSASNYIMRTDYIPPQKNCVSRGLDKLTELIDNYTKKPGLIPVGAD